MQVKVWQSFSSNHSAAFTLVGVFKTPAEAEAAAAWLRELVQAILEAGEAAEYNDEPVVSPTEPEKLAARSLGMAWGSSGIDWVNTNDDPVTTLENLVFIDGSQSSIGAPPTDVLIERL